jgi:hypothetical protein
MHRNHSAVFWVAVVGTALLAAGVYQVIVFCQNTLRLVHAVQGATPQWNRVTNRFLSASEATRTEFAAWYGLNSTFISTAEGIQRDLLKFGFAVPLTDLRVLTEWVDLDADGEVSAVDSAFGLASTGFYVYANLNADFEAARASSHTVAAATNVLSWITRKKPYEEYTFAPLSLSRPRDLLLKILRPEPKPWQLLGSMAVDALEAVANEMFDTFFPVLDRDYDGRLTRAELEAGLFVWLNLYGGHTVADMTLPAKFWKDLQAFGIHGVNLTQLHHIVARQSKAAKAHVFALLK